MIRINLLPVRAAQRKEKVRTQISVLCLGLLFVCVTCGALYMKMAAKIDSKITEIRTTQQEISRLQKEIGEVSRYKKLQADLTKKLEILQVLKQDKDGPVHLLNQLSLSLPDKLWITSFSSDKGAVKISGLCFSENLVAEFMKKLEASPYYKNVELSVTEQTKVSDIKLQKFSLVCQTEKPVEQ